MVNKNLKEIEAKQMLRTDLVAAAPKELTRMQKKMKRMFGAGGNASKLFVSGF